MIKTVDVSPAQARGLADRLEDQRRAIQLAGTYLTALCDAAGLGEGVRLVALEGTTLTVEVPEPPA